MKYNVFMCTWHRNVHIYRKIYTYMYIFIEKYRITLYVWLKSGQTSLAKKEVNKSTKQTKSKML